MLPDTGEPDPGEPDTSTPYPSKYDDYGMLLRLERLHVQDALNARDIAIKRLAGACDSVREMTASLSALQEEKDIILTRLDANESRKGASGGRNTSFFEPVQGNEGDDVEEIEKKLSSLKISDLARDYPENGSIHTRQSSVPEGTKVPRESPHTIAGILTDVSNISIPLSSPSSLDESSRDIDSSECSWISLEGEKPIVALPTVNTVEKIGARYIILASLPLPSNIPEDSLTPILIPPPYTLHDYIGTISGTLRSQLGNYRIFQQSTTTWCPEREEHGYYLTPLFKCSTNPRFITAHNWTSVDLSVNLDQASESFFNKDGKWYYAGIYKSFRLEDLCPQEWECLSPEASQALIKETLVSRKNTSPQTIYETRQLYAAGALKVACIGLQCIGFNNTLYCRLLEHAAFCLQTGKWRAPTGGFGSQAGSVLATIPGSGVPRGINANAPISGPETHHGSLAMRTLPPGTTTTPTMATTPRILQEGLLPVMSSELAS